MQEEHEKPVVTSFQAVWDRSGDQQIHCWKTLRLAAPSMCLLLEEVGWAIGDSRPTEGKMNQGDLVSNVT